MLAARLGELVVGIDGEAAGGRRVEHVHARCGQRNDLRACGSIHVGDAPFAQIVQAFEDQTRPLAGAARVEAPQLWKPGSWKLLSCSSFRYPLLMSRVRKASSVAMRW